MPEVSITPRKEFSFISLPRRDVSERDEILRNFEGVPSLNSDNVLHYRLLRSPSDDPPEGRDSRDRVETWEADDYRTKVNDISRRVLEMSQSPAEPSLDFATAKKEWRQYLNVIEFGGGIDQALGCLRNPGFHFTNLVHQDVGVPGNNLIPHFGVFLRGNFGAGNDQDPERSVLVVRIPYLRPKRISPPESPESSEAQESWSLSKFISQSVTGLKDYPLDDELSVHQAIFAVLNNAVIMVSKSKEDESAGMVFPQQDRVGVFHVLVHMVSETLRSGDRGILATLQSEATRFEIQSIFPNGDSDMETAGRKILGSIAAIKALVAEQTAVLEDLGNIFGRAVPDLRHPSIYSNKYTKTMLRVPVLSGPAERTGAPTERARGQMSYVAATLETVIEERRQFSSKGAGIFETIQKAQATVATSGQAEDLKKDLSEQVGAQAQQAKDLKSALLEQTLLVQEQKEQAQAQADALQEEIEVQGKTLSAFTVVNYFGAGDKNARNGAIGTSLGLFWAVAGPCTFFIAAVAMYFVLESQYEFRQFWRLFADMFTLKGWRQPITKADAASQKNYLKRLPRYRVLVVPAGSGSEPQPGERYYLKGVKFEPNVGRDELPLQAENTALPDGEFRFDEENGWLFHHEVDEYDYMYYAHVGSPTVPPGGGSLPLSWKRSRMVMDEEPYRFQGAFQTEKQDSGEFLRWAFCNPEGETRWYTKEFAHASGFSLERDGQELFVRAPGAAGGGYWLKLVLLDKKL